MATSRIDKSVKYPEKLNINNEDLEKNFDKYFTSILGVEVIILIGTLQESMKDDKAIIYWPIYLVRNNEKVIQIGVFEVPEDSQSECVDIDGKVIVDNIGAPLLYKTFLDPISLERLRQINDSNEMDFLTEYSSQGGGGYGTISDERKDTFTVTKGVPLPNLLTKESYEMSKDISEKYHEQSTDNWIQKYMKNKYYTINEPDESEEKGKDCFFSTIRDAFSSIAQHTSIDKLRNKISTALTEELFQDYKDSANSLKKKIAALNSKLKELAVKHEELKKTHQNENDRNEQQKLISAGKKITDQHNLLKNQIKMLQQISQDYKFIDKINTLEEFKAKVRTCNFWTETNWMLSTVERLLNIKLIVLSNEMYKKKDFDNILDCGILNDSTLKTQGIFTPDFYIILERDLKNNYRLVGYKHKVILKFSEIPYGVKKLVVDKCLEENSGIFSLIPDFESLKSSVTVSTINYDELSPSKIRGLFDNKIKFRFYNKVNNKPLPGKGSGETIEKQSLPEFIELSKYPDWRLKLDNSWVQPFTLHNHKWSSVEHYYQASKFKKKSQDFYLNFSLDSGTALSKDVEMAKGAGSTSGKYKGVLIRPKQVQIEPDFEQNSKNELYSALYAKFSQNDQHDVDTNLKNLLLATKDAKLTHHLSGKAAEICDELMFVREKIKNEVK
jgi:predicted NAD-dependent protein-ADP-ribosyltransferase YbiA (DUF1768 family)